jgi:haloalkane dehalogenase
LQSAARACKPGRLRGIALDLPGLGLADRPDDFDYPGTGPTTFAAAAVDLLGLDRLHLVVHRIGGSVGFELAAGLPERIKSLTALNTLVDVADFEIPWSMRPFERRGLGSVRPRLHDEARVAAPQENAGDR